MWGDLGFGAWGQGLRTWDVIRVSAAMGRSRCFEGLGASWVSLGLGTRGWRYETLLQALRCFGLGVPSVRVLGLGFLDLGGLGLRE